MAERLETAEIYLDHAASTPLRPEARDAWLQTAARHHANPTGAHRSARHARRTLDEARSRVATALGAQPGEVVFTSGGSEADNLAIAGALGARAGVAVTTAVEHHAVLDPVERSGGAVVGVDTRGLVNPAHLQQTLSNTEAVAVVSVIAVNNEVGSIAPLDRIAEVVREAAPDALLHSDAVQAVNWIDVAAATSSYDLVSVTGHKIGAPVGIGALIVRDGVELAPLIVGGGQERGRRAGTPDVAGAVAFATALEITTEQRPQQITRLAGLRDTLLDGLADRLGDRLVISAAPNGARDHLASGIANVCISSVDSEALLFLLDAQGLRASAASSCSSGAQDPSHVLSALGLPRELAGGSLRLSLGHTSVASEVERAVEIIAAAVARLDLFGGG